MKADKVLKVKSLLYIYFILYTGCLEVNFKLKEREVSKFTVSSISITYFGSNIHNIYIIASYNIYYS